MEEKDKNNSKFTFLLSFFLILSCFPQSLIQVKKQVLRFLCGGFSLFTSLTSFSLASVDIYFLKNIYVTVGCLHN